MHNIIISRSDSAKELMEMCFVFLLQFEACGGGMFQDQFKATEYIFEVIGYQFQDCQIPSQVPVR